MRTLVLLSVATIITVAAAASTLRAPVSALSAAAFSPRTVMSIEEIQRKVDMKSLPILDVREPY